MYPLLQVRAWWGVSVPAGQSRGAATTADHRPEGGQAGWADREAVAHRRNLGALLVLLWTLGVPMLAGRTPQLSLRGSASVSLVARCSYAGRQDSTVVS